MAHAGGVRRGSRHPHKGVSPSSATRAAISAATKGKKRVLTNKQVVAIKLGAKKGAATKAAKLAAMSPAAREQLRQANRARALAAAKKRSPKGRLNATSARGTAGKPKATPTSAARAAAVAASNARNTPAAVAAYRASLIRGAHTGLRSD